MHRKTKIVSYFKISMPTIPTKTTNFKAEPILIPAYLNIKLYRSNDKE